MAFGGNGIAPDRIRFVSTPGSYLAAYNDIDIALDPRPFSGVTTTFDAISMGVPVIGLAGQSAMSRLTASVLTSAGFPQWVAPTPDSFVALGQELASDLERLSHLRRTLPNLVSKSPLCDGVSFARSLERLWRDLWRKWCRTRQA
jgi:predicted O-linked N-acetylglucosamine transferase (SPINDLY family)